MKNLTLADKTANITGLVFGVVFFVAIFIGTVVPLGISLDTEDYIQSAIALVYPLEFLSDLSGKDWEFKYVLPV